MRKGNAIEVEDIDLEALMQEVTDITILNSLVADWVDDRMAGTFDMDQPIDPNKLTEEQQQFYWMLYAMRTKEVLISVINRL